MILVKEYVHFLDQWRLQYQTNKQMLERFRQLQPKRKLKVYTIGLSILAGILFLLTISSLSIIASNLMVTNQLSTSVELSTLQSEHSMYIISQRTIIAFDVLCLIFLPLLLFSVFKFYTKGNLIIIIVNSVLQGLRWISAVIFQAGDKGLKQSWSNLYSAAQYGESPVCQIQTCGEGLINYVVCARLELWKQAENFQFGFLIVGIPIVAGTMFLAYFTNQLDLKLVQFSESTD